tara:strand:- start:1168 stop:1470 length:303 start_codon:yes stop_codon:yes gene_type:complete
VLNSALERCASPMTDRFVFLEAQHWDHRNGSDVMQYWWDRSTRNYFFKESLTSTDFQRTPAWHAWHDGYRHKKMPPIPKILIAESPCRVAWLEVTPPTPR